MILGFSNGSFHGIYPGKEGKFSQEVFDLCEIGNAIELNLHSEEEIDYLLEGQKPDLSSFDYISLHAPVIPYSENKESIKILSKIGFLTENLNVKNVVFHPKNGIDWDFVSKFKIPISVENMDSRKETGKSVKEIKSILDQYDFGLTLDLLHCYMNDKSMKLALDFQKEFKNRIVEYHISGFCPDFENHSSHYSLFKSEQDIIIDSLKFKNKPIIIETVLDKEEDNTKEINYIKSKLL